MIQRYGLTFSALLCLLLSSHLFSAQKLTKDQKTELRKYGTISVLGEGGEVKGHFQVKFLPGNERAKKLAQDAWKTTTNLLGSLVNRKDYLTENVWGQFAEGLNIVKESTKKDGLLKIPSDFRRLREDNAKAHGFGKGVQKVYNTLKFVGKIPFRAGVSAAGLVYGGFWGTVVPTFYLFAPVVAAPFTAVFGAGVAPLAVYAWNTGAWLSVKGSDMPQNEENPGFMVRYRDGAPRR